MHWKPEYATGNDVIDEQHKTLVESSHQFRETLNAGEGAKTYDIFLQFLASYARAHFSIEEDSMTDRRCPAAQRTKAEHRGFLDMLEEEEQRFRREGFDRRCARALLDRIDAWLVSHIRRSDTQPHDAAAAPAAPRKPK